MTVAERMVLSPTRPEEIGQLTALMGATFDVDALANGMGDPEPLRCYHCSDLFQRWPPGCLDADQFTLWLNGERAGAAVVWWLPGNLAVLGLLFVTPEHQGCGAGGELWLALEAHYPAAERWLVAAPAWSPKTRRFYEQVCGFTPLRCDGAYVCYEKHYTQPAHTNGT